MVVRSILLTATVAAAFALLAVSASAQEVEVENPGMFSITGENTLSMPHGIIGGEGGPEATGLRCAHQWEANIDSSGHVDFHDIEISAHEGSVGQCDSIDDCDDAGWEGQIEEHSPHWEFALHVNYCLENTGNPLIDGNVFPMECEISADGDEGHCGGIHDGHHDAAEEESYVFTAPVMGIPTDFFVEGEVFIAPPVQMHHVGD